MPRHIRARRPDALPKCGGRVTARGFSPIRHMANSAAMLRYPEYDMDMVRMGVSLYGFSPFVDGLRYAQRWVTRVCLQSACPRARR